mgnify:CR=1 FL=1
MSPHILLIEDDPLVTEFVIRTIRKAGMTIDAVATAEEGITRLYAKRPDCILLDIVLPGMNGLEFLERVKRDPARKDIHVIIISNLGSRDDLDRGIILGADAYLVKSNILPEDIMVKIREVLSAPSTSTPA